MNDEQLEIFKDFIVTYAIGLKDCFWQHTGSGYPIIFARNHYERFLDYFEERKLISVSLADDKAKGIYEEIMVDEINKIITECKETQNEKERKAAKSGNVRRKKS